MGKTKPSHMDVYKRMRKRITKWADSKKIKPAHRDMVMAVPDLFHLMARLVLDERVSIRDRGMLAVGIGYVVSVSPRALAELE